MTTTTNFEIITFLEQIGPKGGPPVEGFGPPRPASSKKTFEIEGPLFEEVHQAHIHIQLYGVVEKNNQVVINGESLDGQSIPRTPMMWTTAMTIIPIGILHEGQNDMQIKLGKGGQQPFFVGSVVIWWKETPILDAGGSAAPDGPELISGKP